MMERKGLEASRYLGGDFMISILICDSIYKALILWLIICIYSNILIDQVIKQVLTILILTILSVVFYRGKLVVHLCLVIICYVFITTIDTIAINCMCYLLGISYNTFVWRKLSYITLTTTDKLMSVFGAWILKSFRKKRNLGNYHTKWIQLPILHFCINGMKYMQILT